MLIPLFIWKVFFKPLPGDMRYFPVRQQQQQQQQQQQRQQEEEEQESMIWRWRFLSSVLRLSQALHALVKLEMDGVTQVIPKPFEVIGDGGSSRILWCFISYQQCTRIKSMHDADDSIYVHALAPFFQENRWFCHSGGHAAVQSWKGFLV